MKHIRVGFIVSASSIDTTSLGSLQVWLLTFHVPSYCVKYWQTGTYHYTQNLQTLCTCRGGVKKSQVIKTWVSRALYMLLNRMFLKGAWRLKQLQLYILPAFFSMTTSWLSAVQVQKQNCTLNRVHLPKGTCCCKLEDLQATSFPNPDGVSIKGSIDRYVFCQEKLVTECRFGCTL